VQVVHRPADDGAFAVVFADAPLDVLGNLFLQVFDAVVRAIEQLTNLDQ
jgi:hypothetical protein